jgi:general secretion pathway protein G
MGRAKKGKGDVMIQRIEIKRQRRAAFTLMEMLIVVAIIVALAGIGGFFIMGQLGGAQKDAAAAQTKVLTKACEAYRIKHQKWPDNLQVLLSKDEYGMVYIDDFNALKDPWGKDYQYDPNGTRNQNLKPDIWTTAPDGTGEIGNWPTLKKTQ